MPSAPLFNAGAAAPALLAAVLLVVVAGCAPSSARPSAPVVPAANPWVAAHGVVVPPFEDVKADDAIVRVVGDVTCTGTLIAEDVVLTAHHCVAARDDRGLPLRRDIDPSRLTVELGDDDLPWAELGVRAVLSPDCGYVSGPGDIALLVLPSRLSGMVTYPPRLDAPPNPEERIVPVGFGRCRASRTRAQRVRRDCDAGEGPTCGDPIRALLSGQIVANASICPGDSGGPALALRSDELGLSHEVVGVVSASAMDGDERTAGVSLFTRLDRFRPLFAAAKAVAAGAHPSDLPPFRACE